MSITLTDSQIRRIARAQSTLLGSLDHPTVDGWMSDCVDAIAELVDADAVTMAVPTPDGIAVRWNEPSLDAATRTYLNEYQQYDTSLTEGRLELPDPTVYHVCDILSPREIRRDLVFAEWRTPNKLFDPLGICLDVGGSLPALVHAYRDRDDGAYALFDAKPIARLLAPSFKAGVRARLRLHALTHDLAGLIDTVHQGVLLFDAGGELVHCNRAARTLLEEDADVEARLRAAAGRLAKRGLARARGSRKEVPAKITTAATLGKIRLELTLLGPRFGGPVAAAVSVTDERERLPAAGVVRRRHGLTRRQAEVALLMARRLSAKEIAKRLGIRPNTARRHCQSVLRRLGIHDRRDVRGVLTGSSE